MQYEVEIRCCFDNRDEAFERFPFLASSLQEEATWTNSTYGLDLFKSGQLLRTSEVRFDSEISYYIGWKGPDIGNFANIRQELDEEITGGIRNSAILGRLGGSGTLATPQEVIRELERLGYKPFMSFHGIDLLGQYEPLTLHTKLLTSPDLPWPFIVEIEKSASTEEEALCCEQELRELCRQLRLQEYLVREEPPTLLYNSLFNH